MRRFQCNWILSLTIYYLLPALFAAGAAGPVFPQTPFYQGKTITLIVGAGPGGMGDLRAKALGSVLAKHIPGNPTITFQYMPGGGGRKAANHMYQSVRPDGLTIGRMSTPFVMPDSRLRRCRSRPSNPQPNASVCISSAYRSLTVLMRSAK